MTEIAETQAGWCTRILVGLRASILDHDPEPDKSDDRRRVIHSWRAGPGRAAHNDHRRAYPTTPWPAFVIRSLAISTKCPPARTRSGIRLTRPALISWA